MPELVHVTECPCTPLGIHWYDSGYGVQVLPGLAEVGKPRRERICVWHRGRRGSMLIDRAATVQAAHNRIHVLSREKRLCRVLLNRRIHV